MPMKQKIHRAKPRQHQLCAAIGDSAIGFRTILEFPSVHHTAAPVTNLVRPVEAPGRLVKLLVGEVAGDNVGPVLALLDATQCS
jgi:hypothetical protein